MLKKIKNKKGQAIVEYVLVLTIIVLIFIALMKPFTEELAKWSSSVFQYYTCLLTSGSLPNDPTNCSIEGDFDPQLGDISGGGGGSGPGGGGSNPENNGGTSTSTAPPSPDNPYPDSQIPPSTSDTGGSGTQIPISTPGGDSSSGRGTENTSSQSGLPLSSSNGRLMSLNDPSHTSSQEGGGEGASGDKGKKLRFKSYPKGFSGYDDSYGGSLTAISSSGSFSEEKEQQAKSAPISTSTGMRKNASFEVNKKSLLKVTKKKKKSKDLKIEGWNFGSWLRILLIICFLVALILIIGSQTSQVRRSLK